MNPLKLVAFVALSVIIAGCGSSLDLLSVDPKTRILENVNVSRSLVLNVQSEDTRSSRLMGSHLLAAKSVPVATVEPLAQTLTDSVSDGMRQQGFRIGSSTSTSNRELDMSIIEASYEANVENKRSSSVTIFVRASAKNDKLNLTKGYEYSVYRDHPSIPSQAQVEEMVSECLSLVTNAILNDTEVLNILSS